ncbi:MAG TPA: NAD(P)/FAD-dependent oxidoreductase, partial [Roseimicrobium sp.]|nr:NAD(P)/FAD-dependent oxidoreductase [Roseimicrobium sp.]
MNSSSATNRQYDVVVLGGALSGAATALILKRNNPALRIVILERTEHLKRRVGEATIELSTYFLSRVLGLTRFLNETQFSKQGLRFWFCNKDTTSLGDSSEVGGKYLSRVPAYLVDRAVMDTEVLRLAKEAGVEVLRPATVQKVELNPGGIQKVHGRSGDEAVTWEARWVVDASGVAALLARQEGWLKSNKEHPTCVAWSRWRGVKDFDDRSLAQKYPKYGAACFGQRGTATNHFIGDGWWAWCIPLKGGDVSIGCVFDPRFFDWDKAAKGATVAERLKSVLDTHPVAREIMEKAEWEEGDVHWRRNLAYSCSTTAGDGFVLVGDASGFLDPFYSPGLDWVSFTTMRAVDLIETQKMGKPLPDAIRRHNEDFEKSYRRWFAAIYKDKYAYMGDYELMRIALLLDVGIYYMGVASQPFIRGEKALLEPYFATPPSVPVFYLMRQYHRRLVAIAQRRRHDGRWGCRNTGSRFMIPGFNYGPATAWMVLKTLGCWIALEVREGWKSWFWKPATEVSPTAASTPV